jgi:hypothetical protein
MRKVIAVLAGTVALLVGTAPAASAGPPNLTGLGAKVRGAVVVHCVNFGGSGVVVYAHGNVGGNGDAFCRSLPF